VLNTVRTKQKKKSPKKYLKKKPLYIEIILLYLLLSNRDTVFVENKIFQQVLSEKILPGVGSPGHYTTHWHTDSALLPCLDVRGKYSPSPM
jgi:hypothetical protein